MAENVRSQYESLGVMNEEDFDVDNFIANAVEEMNKAGFFFILPKWLSFLYHEQINLEKNLNKANELFKSINIEDYETKVADDIRKMEQENRRKLELFDAETKEVVKRCSS